ncbi:hypothetical protein DFH07DRAFT_331852 [Mycena maculata]|uniref:Uncharacterized protein n=1 Tax=Mycena maculata TaxID=230809 RepID=A0AAD7HE74_9AGAR|nr:hypothetical protein DFH07DRAFT_331852 [Mycena maculata]
MEDSPMDDVLSADDQLEPQDGTELEISKSEPISLSHMDQQRMSLWILTQRDRPIESLDSMKAFLDLSEDVSMKRRVDELNNRYEEDLDRVYMAQAEEYLDDINDLYLSFDENDPDDVIESFYSQYRAEGNRAQHEWDHILAHTVSTYNQRLAELTRNVIIDFPQSVVDYRLKPRDVQHRVARFLLLESDDEKERMLSELDLAWRQVTPLSNEFQTNLEFQNEIRAAISESVEQLNVGDPRKR